MLQAQVERRPLQDTEQLLTLLQIAVCEKTWSIGIRSGSYMSGQRRDAARHT